MPDIPAEQNRSFESIWDYFSTVESIADGRHDTDEWASRSGEFVLCCVRIPFDSLDTAFDEIRAELTAESTVRIHPPEFLHIAIQEIGFLVERPSRKDEFTRARLDEFLSYIEGPIGDFRPFTIQLTGVNSFSDAAFFQVRDNGWLSRIHFRMRDFVIFPPNKHFPYLPFATFAHYTTHAPAQALRDRLAPFRETAFGTFQVNEIEIVRIRANEPYPPLIVERSITLGTHRIEAPVRPLPVEPLDNGI